MNGFETTLFDPTDALHSVVAPVIRGIAIWILAIIFAWSGVAKLRRPSLAAMAMVDFGVLHRIRPRLGSTLGSAELLLALFLITGVLPALFLSVAAGLLWLFVALIARSLWSGQQFACFCFGDADSKLSHLTLVRTTILAVLASMLLIAPSPTPVYSDLNIIYGGAYMLQAASAMALIGIIVLGSQTLRLLRMNKDSYTTGNEEVDE
jgi:Methylamine utilisation protein MauE